MADDVIETDATSIDVADDIETGQNEQKEEEPENDVPVENKTGDVDEERKDGMQSTVATQVGESVEQSNDQDINEVEENKEAELTETVEDNQLEVKQTDEKNPGEGDNVDGERKEDVADTDEKEKKDGGDEDEGDEKGEDDRKDGGGKSEGEDGRDSDEKSGEKKPRVMTGKSVQSSIDVKIVRIKDLDIDDSKSDTRSHSSRRSEKTFITAIGDDMSVAPTIDEVQAELDRVMSRQTAEDTLLPNQLPGRTATRNTPATPMTDYRGSPVRSGTKLTLASLPSATKDTIYQRALALMDTRCSSHTRSNGETGTTDQLPLLVPSLPDHPYRHFPESYFYVTQQRPLPAAPVKAWRGYHGNVYFEPLTCRRLDTAPVMRDKSFYNSMVLKSRGTRSVTFSPKKEILNRHQYKRATTKKPGTRQMALLDKSSVIQRMDENVQEDVRWISGMESLGSLRVGRAQSPSTNTSPERDRYDKMKICRGFVSRNSMQFQTLPVVPVKGGRLTHPVSKSQYLTSQYRGSSRQGLLSNRMSTNVSPDLYGFPSSPLPSLDKLQASLQNVEKSREMVFSIPSYTSIPTTDDSTPRSPKGNPMSYQTDTNTKLQSY